MNKWMKTDREIIKKTIQHKIDPLIGAIRRGDKKIRVRDIMDGNSQKKSKSLWTFFNSVVHCGCCQKYRIEGGNCGSCPLYDKYTHKACCETDIYNRCDKSINDYVFENGSPIVAIVSLIELKNWVFSRIGK